MAEDCASSTSNDTAPLATTVVTLLSPRNPPLPVRVISIRAGLFSRARRIVREQGREPTSAPLELEEPDAAERLSKPGKSVRAPGTNAACCCGCGGDLETFDGVVAASSCGSSACPSSDAIACPLALKGPALTTAGTSSGNGRTRVTLSSGHTEGLESAAQTSL